MPSVQKVHIDKALTNISIGYENEQYIANEIFKEVPVGKQSDRYYVYGMERFRQYDDLRAPGTEANEISWTLSDDSYFCEGHALRHAIADEERQNADDAFDLEAREIETESSFEDVGETKENLIQEGNRISPGQGEYIPNVGVLYITSASRPIIRIIY